MPEACLSSQGSHFNFGANCNLCVTQEFFMDHIRRARDKNGPSTASFVKCRPIFRIMISYKKSKLYQPFYVYFDVNWKLLSHRKNKQRQIQDKILNSRVMDVKVFVQVSAYLYCIKTWVPKLFLLFISR